MNTSLAFFYENIQISEKDVEQISDDSCCKITLQNKNNLEIILSQTLILSQINEPPIAKPWNPSDFSLKLQFLGCESKNIGSITLPFELFFLSDNPKRISQWITLFDDPDDDVFDGDLEQDDIEYPRVFLTFILDFIADSNPEKPIKNEEKLFQSFNQNSLILSNSIESPSKNSQSDLLEKFDPKNIDFEDQPEELVKHFGNLLNNLNTPEDLISATNKINEFTAELEHPKSNSYMKRSSNFNFKIEEINLSEKFNKEYEEEISLLKLKLKRYEGVEKLCEDAKKEKTIIDEKHDNLLKIYRESIISMEEKVKELLNENNVLSQKNFTLDQENKQNQIKIADINMKNQSLNLELISLKDLNALKNQELDSKNQIFEIFISELKEKFEKVKEKLLQEEKMKEILFIEQKEMLLKYKQLLDENCTSKQGFLEKETESNINNHKLQSEFEAQIEQLIQEKEALKNAFDENKRTIMQLEEEKTYNLMQFHNLKQEIDELKKEKNLKVEYFSKLIEEYEQKILYLEKEKTEFEISREKQEINHDSEKQESLFQRIKILESQIVENEDNKEKLQMHWLESHHILEEELKEFEKIKEEFIQKCLEDIQIKETNLELKDKIISEKNKVIAEMEYLILEQKTKLNCENYWGVLTQKLRKKIKELQSHLQIYETDKEKLHKGLYKVTQQLIRQTNVTIDQSHTINLLSNEIQRLEANLQAAQEELDELVLNPKNNMAIKLSEEKENLVLKSEEEITEINCLQKTELDEKLEQFVKDNQTLISFEKISEGQYRFGTRIVQAKILKDKIAIRMGGGFMMIQEFIRLFSLQEITKIKKKGKFSLNNSKSATPKDPNQLENNTFDRKDNCSNLRKHITFQNMEGKY